VVAFQGAQKNIVPDLLSILTKLVGVRRYEVELLRSTRSVTPLAWALFTCGLLALCAVVAFACKPAWERQAHLAQQRAQLQNELARLGVATPVSGSISHERESAEEAAALVDEIRRPWHELFDQIEHAQTQDVHLIQLSVEPHFTSLQLVAEGRDLDKIVRFAQRLAGTGPVRTMAMTHQEWRDALGAHVVSASMQGELAPIAATPAPSRSDP